MALDNDLDSLRAALGGRTASKLAKKVAEAEPVMKEEEELDGEEDFDSGSESGSEAESGKELDEAQQATLATKSNIDRALLAKLLGSPSASPEPDQDQTEETDKADKAQEEDDFDRYVRELAFEKRARPSDRLQTEEERAFLAQKDLLQQEEKRKKRMMGLDVDSDAEEGRKKRKKMMPQGDDLEDDFDLEEEAGDEFGLGEGVTESGAYTLQPEPEEVDGSEGSDSASEEEESDADDLLNGEMEFEDQEPEELVSRSADRKQKGKAKVANVAFTYECPATHEDFLETLASVPEDQLGVVVDRIRVLYHPKLAADNKEKLAVSSSSMA